MFWFHICLLTFLVEFDYSGYLVFHKDLALIQLPNGFKLGTSIQPLCLHRRFRMYKQSLRVGLFENISTYVFVYSCWSDWVGTSHVFHTNRYLDKGNVSNYLMLLGPYLSYVGRGKIGFNISSNFLNEAKLEMIPDLGTYD